MLSLLPNLWGRGFLEARFEKYLPKFKKVMPIEFRKVLLENIQIKDIEKQDKELIGK